MITQERLRQLFIYDPDTGNFIRRFDIHGAWKAGQIAGTLNKEGYIAINIDKKPRRAHRLAWLYVYGTSPPEIDHVNGNRADNRLKNLRAATRGQNAANSCLRKNSKIGMKGAYRDVKRKRWFSSISINGRIKHLGTFDTPEEAHAAWSQAADLYHGEFKRVQ